jgi:hypothetical protein
MAAFRRPGDSGRDGSTSIHPAVRQIFSIKISDGTMTLISAPTGSFESLTHL